MKGFGDLIKGSDPVLVDFYADWCGPCKAMSPVLKDIASHYEGKVKVVKVNVDKNQKAAAKFGIRSIPTLIFFNKGKIAWRKSGVVDSALIKKTINGYI